MFDWLGDIFSGIGNAISGTIDYLGTEIANEIFDAMLQWFYEIVYNAVADFFTMMGNMGADIFDLAWVQATIKLFTLFGWSLFVAGTVVAIFDVAIEYQNGRANIKTTSLNILKGFFACSLIGVVPVELYKFCISLQNTFSHDLTRLFAGSQSADLAGQSSTVLEGSFAVSHQINFGLLNLLCMIAFAYCVIKIFFQNIKRGGILLVQMAVGSLYMFSVPRGYSDGFNQWIKQVAAICLTAFMQTTLLFLGLLTFPDHMLLGLGIMLAANEVPRIAQQFGLDSSVKVNMMSVVHPELAREALKQMHGIFVDVYGEEPLSRDDYNFVDMPAVIRGQNGKMCLGIVCLDLSSSGEHWGTTFFTPYGIIEQGNQMSAVEQKFIRQFSPYSYWYSPEIEGDIHVDFDETPDDVAGILGSCRNLNDTESQILS